MKAIIMAGGRGKRLNLDIEKPLIKIEGSTILERIVIVLKETGINEIFVAVTNATPKTKRMAEELNVGVVQTPGDGYVKDIQYLMAKFEEFLAVSADLPFLSSTLIKDVLIRYRKIRRPVSVVVPTKDYENMGFTPTITINDLVPIGVNIVAKGEEYTYIIKGKEAININTKKELEMIINEKAM